MFEWCAVRYKFKNNHQKGMSSKEVGLCAHNLLGLLGSFFQHDWGTCMKRKRKKLEVKNEEDAHMSFRNHKKLVRA